MACGLPSSGFFAGRDSAARGERSCALATGPAAIAHAITPTIARLHMAASRVTWRDYRTNVGTVLGQRPNLDVAKRRRELLVLKPQMSFRKRPIVDVERGFPV